MVNTKTPNYGFNKLGKVRNYDVLLNQNAEMMDTQLKVTNDSLVAGLKVANDKNIATEARVTSIVANASEANTGIVDALPDVDGTPNLTLKARLDKMQTQLVDSERQSTTLSTGVAVVNALANAPARVEIEGRTLIGGGNTPLETGKKYVLADKKTKVIVDGVTHTGVAKFTKTGEAGRATIIRVANIEGKIVGSNVENPHVMKYGGRPTLDNPSTFTVELAQSSYNNAQKLDGLVTAQSSNVNGNIAQQLFSFNLIEAVERNIGRIPRTTVADKVAWLKANVARLTGNWHGFGSSVGGNKANLSAWSTTGVWTPPATSTVGTVGKITRIDDVNIITRITVDGFVHFLAYAEPSDGVIPSVINTDYINLEIELKPDADFTHPRVPLYEVADESYNKILVDWDEMAVLSRYPAVENGSGNHLQGVGIFAEGDNLIGPFTEWTFHTDYVVKGTHEIELNATANNRHGVIALNVKPNTAYTFSVDKTANAFMGIVTNNEQGVIAPYTTNSSLSFNSGNSTIVKARVTNSTSGVGTFNFKNPMLTLGSVAKPFVPRNPSYVIADVKLGAVGTVMDTLAPGDNKTWLLTKRVEKDVVLDGSLAWAYDSDFVGYKAVRASSLIYGSNSLITNVNGTIILSSTGIGAGGGKKIIAENTLYLTLFDTDTGFGETYTPLAAEIKAYFYGYRMNNGTFGTNYDGTGTKTWIPIGDTSNARAVTVVPTSASPTQLDGTIQPYKLSYVLATPQSIDVTDKVEGSLKVNGLTQVEVMSGVVRREKVSPALYVDFYRINHSSVPSTNLKNKSSLILAVYKNGVIDSSWERRSTSTSAYGKADAISKTFDPTAEYTVTYIALDKHLLTANPTNVKLTYAQNLQTAVKDMNDGLQDNSTMLSVHEKSILDLYIKFKYLEATL